MRDIQGHWAKPCIEYLVAQGILSGYPGGAFRPEQAVTRAEFATIIAKAFELPAKRESQHFPDVPDTHWAKAMIAQAYQAGWLSGFTNGTFAPDQPMPRVQILVALAAGLGLVPLSPSLETVKAALSDAAAIPQYAIAGVAAAIDHQLVVNYPRRDRLNPNQSATRADVAAFIYQAYVDQRGLPPLLPPAFIAGTNAQPPANERRGVWLTNVDSEVLFSRQNLAAAIARLADCQFNTIYPTIWHSGFTLFPSNVAAAVLGEQQRLYPGVTRSPREDTQVGRNMLRECLELAHSQGMQVIPWFEYGFFARQGNSLRRRRPHWFTQQRDGTLIDDHGMEWLNPFHPEVQQFYLSLINELMGQYDVDGFQIDDHFGLPIEFGYDPYTIELYRAETGKLSPSNPREDAWMRWRADKITQFVKQVADIVKTRRPAGVFSVSPNPPGFSYRNFLQDWPSWLNAAQVDEVVIQTYRWDLISFVNELRKPDIQTLREKLPISIGVLSGLRNRPMPLPILKQQCQAVRTNGYAGIVFFFYESLWQTTGEPLELRTASLKALFPKSSSPGVRR